jgi:tRNA U34 5-methylaminomethyl-2-thiouridine-forming methyltransferase MnmC
MSDLQDSQAQVTADGSLTLFSPEFGETFHSHYGARQESFLKFIAPTQLAEQAQKPQLRLLDICYGLGYNTAAALETIWSVNPNCCVEVIGLELDGSVPQAAIAHNFFDNWNSQYLEILTQLATKQQVCTDKIDGKLLLGDFKSHDFCQLPIDAGRSELNLTLLKVNK